VSRLPRISGKDLLAAFLRAGFTLTHVRGSHHYLRKARSGKLVVVPIHGGQTIPLGTLKSVLRQAELSSEELVRLLEDEP
jgi:predicted RNA binding protein YcfA (HicA-like mRNA interferase family)